MSFLSRGNTSFSNIDFKQNFRSSEVPGFESVTVVSLKKTSFFSNDSLVMPRIPIGVLCRCSLRQLGDLRYATPTKTEFEAVAAVLHVVLTRVPGYCAHHDFVKVFFCGAYEYSAAQPQILRILSPGNEASWTKTTSHHSAPAGLAGPPPLLHPHPLFLPPQRSTAKTSRVLLPSPLCVDLVAARLVPRLVPRLVRVQDPSLLRLRFPHFFWPAAVSISLSHDYWFVWPLLPSRASLVWHGEQYRAFAGAPVEGLVP